MEMEDSPPKEVFAMILLLQLLLLVLLEVPLSHFRPKKQRHGGCKRDI